MLASEIHRNERGADVCHKVVKAAVNNVPGDDSKGFHYVDAYCNKPVILNISQGGKMCPSCDKEPPVGNVHPRTINSSMTALTPKEMQDCGLYPDGTPINPKAAVIVRQEAKLEEAIKAVEAKVSEVKKDVVVMEITLDRLEGAEDITAVALTAIIHGMDKLPVSNFAESKRLLRLQEKIEKLMVA